MSARKPNDLPYMAWYEGDFRFSTIGWPREARCAYRELLMMAWDLAALPRSEKALAELAQLPVKRFRAHWCGYIRSKFIRVKGGWQNPRILRDREYTLQRLSIWRESGRKGGHASARGGGPKSAAELAPGVVANLHERRTKTRDE